MLLLALILSNLIPSIKYWHPHMEAQNTYEIKSDLVLLIISLLFFLVSQDLSSSLRPAHREHPWWLDPGETNGTSYSITMPPWPTNPVLHSRGCGRLVCHSWPWLSLQVSPGRERLAATAPLASLHAMWGALGAQISTQIPQGAEAGINTFFLLG